MPAKFEWVWNRMWSSATKSNDAKLITLSQVAYTFDAGPNACIYLLEKEVPKFLSFLNIIYPNDELPPQEYIRGIPVELKTLKETVNRWKMKRITFYWVFIIFLQLQERNAFGPNIPFAHNVFKYIIHTKIGDGPSRLDDSESLLDADGNPKSMQSDNSRNPMEWIMMRMSD